MARTVKILVRLSPDMARRLEQQCERFGMGRADLAAFAIGQWVVSQETVQRVRDDVGTVLERAVREVVDHMTADPEGRQRSGS